MFQPHLPETEITYRQHMLRTEYMRAQRQVSIAGIRQILGNTVIELGSRIHGMAQESCVEATEIREALRASNTVKRTTITH